MRLVRQAQQRQHLLRPLSGQPHGHVFAQAEDHLQLLQGGESGEKIEGLKDESAVFQAKAMPRIFGQFPEVLAMSDDLT